MRRAFTATVLLLALTAAPAVAQATYSTPGTLGDRTESTRDRIMRAYQGARWQLGPIELTPQLSVGNLSYVSNVYSTSEDQATSDLRGGATAGLRAFFNLGPKIVVSPFVDLSYSWWQEQEDLRALSESFGIQFFGDFNRLQAQLQIGRVETQRNLSSEVEVPVNPRSDRAEFDVDVDIRGPLRFFAGARTRETRYSGSAAEQEVPGLILSTIDSDDEQLNGGLSYEHGSGLRVGLGYVRTEIEYLDDPQGRSQIGTGPLLRVDFEGSRLSIRLDAARRDLDIRARAGANKRQQVSGIATLGWKFGQRLSSSVYQGIELHASALDAKAIFETQRTGVSVSYETGPRSRIGAFYEAGDDEYATALSDQVTRVDDFTSYGASYRLDLSARWSFELGYLDSRRESSDPVFERDFNSLNFRLSLGGNLLPWQP